MGVSEVVSYEESRQRRLEENKKRMEELNLHKLSASLRNAISPKSSSVKKPNPRTLRSPVDLSAVRRSNRFVDKPSPNYKEVPIEPLGRPKRSYQRRDLLNRVYASDEARLYNVERAEELQSGLETEFPSFVKPMLQSHVTGGFWLGLPVHFCKSHLPSHDEMITLVDEDGNESLVKYLAEKTGLSGGWRGFAIDHELVDGDALVFQLIKNIKFQVYIIRSDQSKDGDDDSDASPVEVNVKRTRAILENKKLFSRTTTAPYFPTCQLEYNTTAAVEVDGVYPKLTTKWCSICRAQPLSSTNRRLLPFEKSDIA